MRAQCPWQGFTKQAYLADVNYVRHRLRTMYSNLVHPYGLFMQRWDVAMTSVLLFTTFVTPFEVGLNLETSVNALFVINQACSLG